MSSVPRRAPVALALFAALAAAVVLALVGGGARAAAQAGSDDPSGSEQRIQALLADMSLREKVGQMGQINLTSLQGSLDTPWDRGPLNQERLKEVLDTNQIGSLLSGGGAWPSGGNDARAWAEEINALQRYAIEHQKHRIPLLYGVDAVHGHNNLSNAIEFPHQIGIGASFNPALAGRLGQRTSEAVRATGIHWNFAPVLDTERDLRWGRSYEPFSEDPFLNGVLGASAIRGIEGPNAVGPVAATAKHFIGYSAPDTGQDRTDATISDAELRAIHLPPFKMGVDAGVDTVMANSGSVNGEPVHASRRLLTDVLRGELGFEGVVISDWQDIENLITKYRVATDMEDAVAQAVNAGVDMSMIPIDATGFVTAMEKAVANGRISQARIDQAVTRILRLKFKLGLFENPYADAGRANQVVEDPADRPLARRAARESLVLLENDGTLPLRRSVSKLLVTGPASDSPANQLGGWSLGWQGAFGLPSDVTLPPVTTVREGIEAAAPRRTEVTWRQGAPAADTLPSENASDPYDPNNLADTPAVVAARDEAVAAARDADAVVVAVGESPYAETRGNMDRPALTPAQAALVDALEATGKPVVIVVVAGRPLEMDRQLDAANASLMAFLPGSEGGSAIADALFGTHDPSGRLPVSWPRDGASYPIAYNEPGSDDRRYGFGHGLGYTRFAATRLRAPAQISRRDGAVELRVTIRNLGSRSADRVVLATAEKLRGSGWAPAQLVAFERTRVSARGQEQVTLRFDASQLAPGEYRLDVDGASQRLHVR